MDSDTRIRAECQNCGAPLDPSEMGPCPSCGQLAGKKVYATMKATSRSSVSFSASVKKWRERYEVLLDTAKRLRDEGYHEAAIVMAQTACEVCTEAVLTEALRERVRDDAVVDRITDSLRNYSPKNDSVKKWFELLFGYPIQDEPLWQPLKKHVRFHQTPPIRRPSTTPR